MSTEAFPLSNYLLKKIERFQQVILVNFLLRSRGESPSVDEIMLVADDIGQLDEVKRGQMSKSEAENVLSITQKRLKIQ